MLRDDRKLLGEMFDSPELIEGGCTALAMLLVGNEVFIANAGDCQAIYFNKKSHKIEVLSKEHKPEKSEEKKWIEKAGGTVDNGRINENLNVSRALGDFEFKSNKDFSQKEQMVIAEPDVQVKKLTG